MASAPHRSSAAPLAAIFAAVIVYASLYPFDVWRAFDSNPFAFLLLPLPRWWTAFDVGANLIGYMPFGAMLFGALVRSHVPTRAAIRHTWLAAFLLSLSLEVTQNFLPRRVASNVDLVLNTLGAGLGIAVALAIHRLGWVDRWQQVRERWLIPNSAGGLALLITWPLGLLIPTPVALGVGRILPRLHELLSEVFQGTPFAPWLALPVWTAQDFLPLSALAEVSTVALGLLAPCLLAFTITRPGWRRLSLVPLLAGVGVLATTLSTAVNFGPQHALAWFTDLFWLGMGGGALLALLASRLAARTCMAFGLVALTALVVGVAQAPADPYFAQSLQAWEQGDFIRFHGAAQWVGLLWPFVALTYLLLRTARFDPYTLASAAPTVPPIESRQ